LNTPVGIETRQADLSPTDRAVALRLVVGLFLFYIAFSGGHLYSMDDHTHHAVLDAIWTRGSIAIDDAAAARHLNTSQGVDGRVYSYYGIGAAILSFPFYLAGWAAGALTGRTYYLSQAGMSLTNAFLTACTAALIFSTLRKIGRAPRASLATALVYAVASPALVWSKTFYTSVMVGALFLLALRLLLEDTPASSFLAGFALGLAVNVRYDAAIGAVLIPILVRKLRRRDLLPLAAAALPFAAILFGYNFIRFGSPLDTGYADFQSAHPFQNPLLDGVYGLLLSPNRGLILYGPLFVFLPFVATRFGRIAPRLAAAVLLVSTCYLIEYASYLGWDGGVVWGPRHLGCVLPLITLSFVELWSANAAWVRRLITLVLSLSVAVQLWGGIASADSYGDLLTERGINPVLSSTDPALSPIWGIRHIIGNLSLTRLSDTPPRDALPAGGHPITRKLRYLPDFWPAYAWALGVPAIFVLTLWGLVLAAAVAVLIPLRRRLRTA
jgi:hypothetical protein